jgi:hypothetical protein
MVYIIRVCTIGKKKLFPLSFKILTKIKSLAKKYAQQKKLFKIYGKASVYIISHLFYFHNRSREKRRPKPYMLVKYCLNHTYTYLKHPYNLVVY